MKTIKGLNLSIDIDELIPILEKEGYVLTKKEPPQEFKVGDWVICDAGNGCVSKLHRLTGSGLDCPMDHIRLAAPQEIESHLIKEAEKKGFEKGVKCKWHDENIIYTLTGVWSYGARYYPENDSYFLHGIMIYCKGKWAEIVQEKRRLPKTKEEFICLIQDLLIKSPKGYDIAISKWIESELKDFED